MNWSNFGHGSNPFTNSTCALHLFSGNGDTPMLFDVYGNALKEQHFQFFIEGIKIVFLVDLVLF